MLASGSPWSDRRLGADALDEVVRKVLLTYWNTASFQTRYGRAAGWHPSSVVRGERPALDRWVRSELAGLVVEVGAAMDAFDAQRAGRALAEFVDRLSNWYVRRSRRRFWRGDPAALAALHECLETLTRLMAPLVPFVTERVWQALVVAPSPDAATSVHLTDWPTPDLGAVDPALAGAMALVRRVVEVGRAARAGSGVKVRQPLARALVAAPGWAALPPDLRAEVMAELNVGAVDTMAGADVLDVTVRPDFRALGRRFGPRTQRVAAAVRAPASTSCRA